MSSNSETNDLKLEIQRLKTELKHSQAKQQELLSHKRQIDAIFDNAPAEIYLKDHEGRYLKINKQFEKIFGVRNKDLVGKFPDTAHDPELAASTRAQDLAVLNSGEIISREEQARLVIDDSLHTLLTVKFPVFDEAGEVNGLGAIVTDITDQKLAEERFRDMVNNIEGIVWEAETESFNITFVSQQAKRILGYDLEEWYQDGFWQIKLHPEDRSWVPDYYIQKIAESLQTYEVEYRMIASDGRTVWFRELGSVNQEQGQPCMLRGISVDISRLKASEETIKTAEARFRTMFMSAPVGMTLSDAVTGRLVEINPAYGRIIGRSFDEMQSKGWRSYSHPDDLQDSLDYLEQINQGSIPRNKLVKRFIKPDGKIIWAELSISPITTTYDSGQKQILTVIEDITERKQFEEKVWYQAHYDFLTGLPNRNMVHDRLTQLIKKHKRDGSEFAVLLLDLDQFKEVNDTLGHDVGDTLLVQASRRIQQCLRETDTVARLGGDEFIVVLGELSSPTGIEKVAHNINRVLTEPFVLGNETAFVTASIGITLFPQDADDITTLIKNADRAMYEAKKQGRNRYHLFTQLMQDATLGRCGS